MVRKRKTVDVNQMREYANAQLARTDSFTNQDKKAGVCAMIETVLMTTGNYKGFNHTKWLTGGCEAWERDGKPENKEKYIGQEYDRYYY